jgi:hypothetical protein
MREEMSKSSDPSQAELQGRLQALRTALLALHKSLVDSERIEYEKTIGRIQSPNHFLQLLTSDPWFTWLSPLSQLIVSIDEAQDSKEPLTQATVDALAKQANGLLVASESGEGFARHYFDALQRDPDVVLAQGNFARLRPAKKSK